MIRNYPYDEEAICEECGVKGAFDIMGDFICPICLILEEEDATNEQKEKAKSHTKLPG